MNKTNKKLIVVIAALALALVASVGSTLALLTAKTPGLVNTFEATKGLILNGAATNFTLTETGAEGDVENGYTKTYDNFIPGEVLSKDPKLAIATSVTASAYVFVEVVVSNNSYTKAAGGTADLVEFAINDTNWQLVEGLTGAKGGLVYIYKVGDNNVLAKGEGIAATSILKNDQVTIADYAEEDTLPANNPTIAFYGYAMQSLADGGAAYENFGTAYTTAFGGNYVAPQA